MNIKKIDGPTAAKEIRNMNMHSNNKLLIIGVTGNISIKILQFLTIFDLFCKILFQVTPKVII